MRNAVIVLSFELLELLESITPVVAEVSSTSMRRLPAGLARHPERWMLNGAFAANVVMRALSITVVPSHNLALIPATPAVSLHSDIARCAPCARDTLRDGGPGKISSGVVERDVCAE
jgi:hypothetical protein